MDNAELVRQIDEMVAEEHELRSRHHVGPLDEADAERLIHLEERLDQAWDLLRQRRARREFGDDPDVAQVRDPATVESYRQ